MAVVGAGIAFFKWLTQKEKRRKEEEKRKKEEEKRKSQRWVLCKDCGHLKEL